MSDELELEDKDALARARAVALGSEDASVAVEHKGVTYEVRALSLHLLRSLRKQAQRVGTDANGQKVKELDNEEFMALTLIHATYLPGTQTRIFNIRDKEVLLHKPASAASLIGKLTLAYNSLDKPPSEEEVEEIKGKSEGTPSSSPASR